MLGSAGSARPPSASTRPRGRWPRATWEPGWSTAATTPGSTGRRSPAP